MKIKFLIPFAVMIMLFSLSVIALLLTREVGQLRYYIIASYGLIICSILLISFLIIFIAMNLDD